MKQVHFAASTNYLRLRVVNEQMQRLSASELRGLVPNRATSLAELAPRSVAITELIKHIAEEGFERTGQGGVLKEKRDHPAFRTLDRVGANSGMIRDVDGNVIHVGRDGRPFVVVGNGEILYVQVYKVRINPKGQRLDAKCTIEAPDGMEEVLLVEPLPQLESGD